MIVAINHDMDCSTEQSLAKEIAWQQQPITIQSNVLDKTKDTFLMVCRLFHSSWYFLLYIIISVCTLQLKLTNMVDMIADHHHNTCP